MKPKRVVSLLVAGCMAVSMVPASAVTAFAETVGNTPTLAVLAQDAATSGPCGAEGQESSVQWSYDADRKILTISGTGRMADYPNGSDTVGSRPWDTYQEEIEEVKIEEGVTGIGANAFKKLTNLKKANIPSSATYLGNNIYSSDTNLTDVEWGKDFKAPSYEDFGSPGGTFNGSTSYYTGTIVPVGMFDGDNSLGLGTELTEWLPKSFTGVGCGAFRGTKFSVDFDKWDNLTYIGIWAFSGMDNLDSFTLSDKIQFGVQNNGLNSLAFVNSGLKSLTIENGTNTIPQYTFQGTKITELEVPASVTEIGDKAFLGCQSLKTLTLCGKTKLTGNVFSGCNSLETFVIKDGAEITCTTNPFDKSITYKYDKISSLKNVEIEGTLESCNETYKSTTLWNDMFGASEGITEVKVSGPALQYVSKYAFPKIKTLNVENGEVNLTSENNYKFNFNTELTQINIDVNTYNETLDSVSFRNAQALETFKLKATSAQFGSATFVECKNLNVIDLTECGSVGYTSSSLKNMTPQSEADPLNESVRIYVADEEANPRTHTSGLESDRGIVFVTNGGLVNENATGFDSVIRAGYTATWYEDNNFQTKTTDTTPQKGKTYYAKWSQNASMEADVDQKGDSQTATVTVGKPIEVTVTVNPGDNMLAILNGKAKITFTDPTAVESLSCNGKTYTGKELADAEYTLKVSDLIPSSDAGSGVATYAATTAYPSAKLSIVFNKKGSQKIHIELLDNQDNLLCESDTTVAVEEEKKPEETKPDDTKKDDDKKEDTKPENPVSTYALTVKNAEVTVKDTDGKAVEVAKAEDGTLTANVPEKAEVTVKYTAPTDAIEFDLWSITSKAALDVNVKENPLTFTMPDKAVTIEAMTRDATIESEGPGVLGTAAIIGVGVAGTAVLGYQGYMIGTELYLNTVLPEWAVIPQNRGELAVLLWKDADQPEPTENVIYTDIDENDTDTQKAARWAVENGLMELLDKDSNPDHFDSSAPVTRWEVIQTWNKAQEMKG